MYSRRFLPAIVHRIFHSGYYCCGGRRFVGDSGGGGGGGDGGGDGGGGRMTPLLQRVRL